MPAKNVRSSFALLVGGTATLFVTPLVPVREKTAYRLRWLQLALSLDMGLVDAFPRVGMTLRASREAPLDAGGAVQTLAEQFSPSIQGAFSAKETIAAYLYSFRGESTGGAATLRLDGDHQENVDIMVPMIAGNVTIEGAGSYLSSVYIRVEYEPVPVSVAESAAIALAWGAHPIGVFS